MSIQFNHKDVDYTLEYNRESAKQMEKALGNIGDLQSKPLNSLPIMFYFAFKKNHPSVSRALSEEIYSQLDNKQALLEALTEMLSETIETLFEAPKKNAIKWEKK